MNNQPLYFQFLKSIFFVALIIFFSDVEAQSTKRIEIPSKINNQTYQTISLAEEGVLLLSSTGKKTFSLTKYDTDLEQVWTLDGELEESLTLVDSYKDKREVYFLFSKYNSDLYQIIKVSTGIGSMQKLSFENLKRFEISEFKVHNDVAYMAGKVKEEPVLMSINLNKMQPRVLAGGIKGTASISAIEFDDLNRQIAISYSVKKGRSSYVVVRKINENGKTVDQQTIEPEKEYGLLTGKLFHLEDSTELMIGNYGYAGYQSNGVPMSQGLYISKLAEEDQNPNAIKMHSFTEFKNFFKFLSEKQQEKMAKKIRKKKDKGEDLKLNYRVLVHDIIKKDNQYILVAEVFYPEFRTNNATSPFPSTMGMWGSPFYNSFYAMNLMRYYGMNAWAWNPFMYPNLYNNNNQQQFDGFKYTHAIVAGFDSKGDLLWDNSFNFDNVKSMELKEKVKVKTEGDEILLVYSNKGELVSKIVKGNEVVEGTKKIRIDTQKEGDKIRNTETDDIEYWYDNYYLTWGYQKISNRDDGNRNVFYLNKIVF